MHISQGMARARTNCPTHNGNSETVRVALERRGPLTKTGIATHTGLKPAQVDHAISHLLKRGISSFVKPNGQRFYALPADMPKPVAVPVADAPYAIAGPITIGRGARWIAGTMKFR
jgi:hypothetical protein